MNVGRFIAGVAAVIWSPESGEYLLLHRARHKDYAPSAWEWVTGRVDQGEGFEDALHREVHEELAASVHIDHLLGTTHFYRGTPSPENELLGVVYLCSLVEPANIHLSAEHSEYRWLSADQAFDLLTAPDPSTHWARRVLQRVTVIHPLLPHDLLKLQRHSGFELG